MHSITFAVEDLVREVENLGYKVEEIDSEVYSNIKDANQARNISRRAWKAAFIGSGICNAVLVLIRFLPSSMNAY